MPASSLSSIPIQCEADIVAVRQLVKELATKLELKLIDKTKLITAASEIARNTLIYGKGGVGIFEVIEGLQNRGIKLIFEDRGPGIENIERALSDGYTSGRGMGLGLSGSKRLVDEFDIKSKVNQGTTVTLVKWKN